MTPHFWFPSQTTIIGTKSRESKEMSFHAKIEFSYQFQVGLPEHCTVE